MTRSKKDAQMDALAREYKDIREDYRFEGCDEFHPVDKPGLLKWIIEKRLGQVERTIFLLYCELASYRLLGRRLGISHTVIARKVNDIRRQIITEYKKYKDNELL